MNTRHGYKTQPWQRELAYRLWVQEQTSTRFIERTCGISHQTLAEWRLRNKWDEQREQHSRGFSEVVGALQGALALVAAQMQDTQKAETGNSGNSDDKLTLLNQVSRTMHQLVTTLEYIRRVQNEQGPSASAIKVCEDLLNFVKHHDRAMHTTLQPVLRRYLRDRVLGRAGEA